MSEEQKHYRNSKMHTDKILEKAKKKDPLKTAVVHPASSASIEAVKEALDEGLIDPTLIGPRDKITQAAEKVQIDVSTWKIIDTEHSHQAAEMAAEMAGNGQFEALMKGSLHSDEILRAILHQPKLKTERRISHVYAMDVKTYHKPFMITDAAINVAPDLATKADIVQNAVNLYYALYRDEVPKVAVLAAVETVNPKMQATIDAACLCKMVERGQIEGKIKIDGPLAFDNAISRDAAAQKGIVSEVAGDPDIMVAPEIEAANIMCKQLTFIAEAEAAGIVLGARVPVILTSRADPVRARLLSCALAVHLAVARREGRVK